jgi:hypothetical protein
MARRINLPLSVYLIIEMARGVTSRYLFIWSLKWLEGLPPVTCFIIIINHGTYFD